MNIPRYSVTFALLPRAHRDGSHSVAVTVTWCSRRYRHTLPVACPPDCWDTTVQLARPRGQFRDTAAVNGAILDTRQAIDDLFLRLSLDGKIPTLPDLAALVEGGHRPEERRTLDTTLREFVDEQSREHSWQHGTAVKFTTLSHELHACGISYLDEINEAAKGRYHALLASRGLRNTTLSKKLSIFNWFLRWCNERGYTSAPLNKPHLRTVPRTVTYLDWDELTHFYRFDFGEHYALAHVRDIFCLCAFTGLRYSDAAALRRQDIRDGAIHIVTQKTADPLVIPLNKYASGVLSRYDGLDGRLLRAPTNQAANRLLKDAAMLAQLDRPVRQVFFRGSERCEEVLLTFEDFSTHWARRTFVVHSLRLGIPSEVVLRFTGHSNLAAMRPYIAIADELKVAAMSKFDEV